MIHTGHETPPLPFGRKPFTPGLELGIQFGHAPPEILDAALEIFLRNEKILFHIVLFDPVTGFTRKDNQLTHDIHAAQVDARIGLGIPRFFGQFNSPAHRYGFVHFVENEVQRTRNHRLDLQDAVAAVDQVADRIDNRQACSHVGLEQEFNPTRPGDILEFQIMVIFG